MTSNVVHVSSFHIQFLDGIAVTTSLYGLSLAPARRSEQCYHLYGRYEVTNNMFTPEEPRLSRGYFMEGFLHLELAL